MERTELKALVLAGGRSTRLGQDKARLAWSGRTLLARSLDLAGQCCAEVWVSGRDPAAESLDAPWLPDPVSGAGPMAGIVSGLRRLRAPLLVLACDMPFLDRKTLELLLAAWEERPGDRVMTCLYQPETGYIQALAAVYEPGAEPLLSRALESGLFKINQALGPELRHHVPYPEDADRVFFNVNSPEDLALLERLDREKKASEEEA